MASSEEKSRSGPATDHRETAPAEGVLVGPDSDTEPTISIVMPTMNEEEGITECIEMGKRALAELGVPGEIVISDSSDDDTPKIAHDLGAIVVTPDKKGYGYAYRFAFERARGKYIVMGDADTTYDFEELPRLLQLLQEESADIAMGSRLDGEILSGAMPPLHQYIGNPLLTRFLNTFYDVDVSDAHSGFRVFTSEALDDLDLQSDGMEFASEMIMDAGEKDLKIVETPITYHPRKGEATLESFEDGWRHVRFMLVNAPDYLFSVPGLLMGLTGTLLMGVAYFGVSVAGQPFGIHSMIAGSLLTIHGFQVGSFGLLTELVADPIRQPEDAITNWVRSHFTLERGIGLGLLMFFSGSIVAAYLVYQWVQSGFTELPLVSADILAFTLIILGLQTVFGSFFVGIAGE
ncbi:glycosyltransferase family 2 protein [Haloplanus salinarum]